MQRFQLQPERKRNSQVTSRSLYLVKLVAVNLLIGMAGVLMLELWFGNWFGNNPMALLNIPRNGTWQYEALYPGVSEAERRVIYTRDEYGFRGAYGETDNVVLVTFGGSTTEQRMISEGFTWQDIIQEKFEQAGIDFKIANAGLNGRTTFGHIQDLRQWMPLIPNFSPRFVLFYVGINDMFHDNPNGERDLLVKEEQNFKDIIKSRSAIYFVFRTTFGVYLAKKYDLTWTWIDYTNAQWTDIPLRSDYFRVLQSRLESYRERLVILGREVRKMNAIPVFVTQKRGDYHIENGVVFGLAETYGKSWRWFTDNRLGELKPGIANGVDYYIILELFNNTLMSVCQDIDGICIDLAGEIKFETGDFYDQTHNTRAGARKIGDYLYPLLEKEYRDIQ
jgi:hypothetical protein